MIREGRRFRRSFSPQNYLIMVMVMAALQVDLFGKFCAKRNGRIIEGLEAHKIQELFCHLLLYCDQGHQREKLASLLWSNSTTEQSKKSLRQALWQLKTALSVPDEPDHSQALLVEPDWVQINASSDLRVDAVIFERIFKRVQGASGESLDHQAAQELRQAIDLYQGELLEGCYQDWCLYERQRFQNMYLSMLDKLVVYAEASREYEMGLIYGLRILRYDRARERTHRQLMRLYYLAGDRATALRQYEHCVAALDEELSVKPSARTVTLHQQIRADQLRDEASTPVGTGGAAPILSTLMDRLKQHWGALIETQGKVQQDIEAVERLLRDRDS